MYTYIDVYIMCILYSEFKHFMIKFMYLSVLPACKLPWAYLLSMEAEEGISALCLK